jgi:hypothetical protein
VAFDVTSERSESAPANLSVSSSALRPAGHRGICGDGRHGDRRGDYTLAVDIDLLSRSLKKTILIAIIDDALDEATR